MTAIYAGLVITGWQGWVFVAGMCATIMQIAWISISRRHAFMRIDQLEKAMKDCGVPVPPVPGPSYVVRVQIRKRRDRAIPSDV